MKFAIITHAAHKIKGEKIFAYEPYVREMNLWLKYVDEVTIVAPISCEKITSIESNYHHPIQHSKPSCPEAWQSEAISINEQISSSQAPRNDKTERHSERSEAILSNKQIASLQAPCNDKTERHRKRSEASLSNEQISSSQAPRNDKTERHSELVSESSEKKSQIPCQARNDEDINQSEAILKPSEKLLKDELLNQVQQGESEHHSELVSESHKLNLQKHKNPINLLEIPAFDITSIKNSAKAFYYIPENFIQIFKAMQWANHIHLRCPGNVGLLGCFIQLLFPSKPKTIKYAGNWDPKSKQPISYRIQKWILSNTFLTKNAKVLVYGKWPNQSKNIVPFFTASYSEEEIIKPNSDKNEAILSNKQIASSQAPRNDKTERHSEPACPADRRSEAILSKKQIAWSRTPRNNENEKENLIKFIFVGSLTKGKQPLLSVQVVHQLKEKGYQVTLDIYGEGEEKQKLQQYISSSNLKDIVYLHGNVDKEIVKLAYKNSNFLLFISKSEGWPKVVAEAMFWGCLPITSRVSCLPEMLGNGTRGSIVNKNVDEIVTILEEYIKNEKEYLEQTQNAMKWARQYTLEKFEEEIKRLVV